MYHVTVKTSDGTSATSTFDDVEKAEEYISTLLYMHGMDHINISANFGSTHLAKHIANDVRSLPDS